MKIRNSGTIKRKRINSPVHSIVIFIRLNVYDSMYYMYVLYHFIYVSFPKSIESAGIRRKTKLLPIKDNVYHSSSIWFGLRLHRHPLYHVFNLVLPTILLALLSAFVFIIPMESGDKISYIITILLAFFIFLLLLSGHIPPTPGAGPLLGKTYITAVWEL